VRDRIHELGSKAEVVVVTFTEPGNIEHYVRTNDLPFTVVVDQTLSAYRSFGLGRGSVARVYGWKTLRRYVQILRSTGPGALRRTTEDTLQLGGNFIIGPDGTLVYGHWGEGPADRPTVDELIRALRQAG